MQKTQTLPSLFNSISKTKMLNETYSTIFQLNKNKKQLVIIKGKYGQFQLLWSCPSNPTDCLPIQVITHTAFYAFKKNKKKFVYNKNNKQLTNLHFLCSPQDSSITNFGDAFRSNTKIINSTPAFHAQFDLQKKASTLLTTTMIGVSQGFSKSISLKGIGYAAKIDSQNLRDALHPKIPLKKGATNLKIFIMHYFTLKQKNGTETSGPAYKINFDLGFSHNPSYFLSKTKANIQLARPMGVHLIVLTGISKIQINQIAAEIQTYRKPEPYKGKGIRYDGEKPIFLKQNKDKK